jgi:hypothetical protein
LGFTNWPVILLHQLGPITQHHARKTPGLQACLPTGDGGRDIAADAEKKSRNPSIIEL